MRNERPRGKAFLLILGNFFPLIKHKLQKEQTMKKIYNVPTLEVVKIQTQQMLAASVQMFNENANSPGMSREFEFTLDGEY